VNKSQSDQATIVPFHDGVDGTGQNILAQLQRAASFAEKNTQQAIAAAQKCAMQLRVAEDRIHELERDVAHYRHRAEKAEGWIHRISQQIEQQFGLQQDRMTSSSTKRSVGFER
jgi:hypothetical protein